MMPEFYFYVIADLSGTLYSPMHVIQLLPVDRITVCLAACNVRVENNKLTTMYVYSLSSLIYCGLHRW